MKQMLGAACAGALLMACSGLSTAPPVATAAPETDITALEQACLQAPLDAARWERLAAALEADGQRERAATMYQQASTLRTHDIRRDYALLKEHKAETPPEAADTAMPRTEIRQLGAALVQVMRVGAATQAQTQTPAPENTGLRLEISNGNGIAGAAARLARILKAEGIKTTRLTNVKNFGVPISRIEYQGDQQLPAQALSRRLGLPLHARSDKSVYADMRIVLGRDVVQAPYLK
ncbi:LytR C-terminal domain-containing protein [Duganella hordei]|uniref:LytR C-terminal domain-containing protein n=1 Tax=Duganella hordei TaxID=2865934 RepID=UPI0030E82607